MRLRANRYSVQPSQPARTHAGLSRTRQRPVTEIDPNQPEPMRLTSEEDKERLMIQAAKLYYDLNHNQNEVARELGLTRWQVGRLLREARDTGVVRIEIAPRSRRRIELETALQRRFGLRDAVVVTAPGADEQLALPAVAMEASRYLKALNPKPELLGVSWGRTMTAVAHWLTPGWTEGLHVVLLNGATNIRITAFQANMVVERFAETARGQATLLPVPAIIGDAESRTALEKDPVVSSVLALAGKAPVACFGMGALGVESILVQSGYLDAGDVDALRAKGAVGDFLGRFVDAEGRIVDADLDARTIGLSLEAVGAKPWSIGVSAGIQKKAITLAGLRAKVMNVLIADEALAQGILEAAGDG